VEHLEAEVHPDGGAVVLGEHLVHVALDHGRLAHAEVADHQDFEQALALHFTAPGVRAGGSARAVEMRSPIMGSA